MSEDIFFLQGQSFALCGEGVLCGEACGETKMPYSVVCYNTLILLARQERFERPTYRFVACCSIQLGYWRAS